MIVGKLYRKAEKVLNVKDCPGAQIDTDATITIKLLEPGMRKKAFDVGYEIGMQPAELVDEEHQVVRIKNGATEYFVYKNCIVSWNGFYEDDKKEKQFECNTANIAKLAALWPEAISWIADEHGKLAAETRKAQEGAVKN